jgi:phosphoribosyl-ATP pyrophosphohydrolase
MSIKDLANTIAARKSTDPSESWTAKLLANPDKAAEKFGEEAVEAIIEATKGDKTRLTSEAADVMYHLLVMCAAHGVTLDDIEAELAKRTNQSGLAEKASR